MPTACSPSVPQRRGFLVRAASAVALASGAGTSARAATRDRALRVIVPFAPGGPSDAVLRALGEYWLERTGRVLLIEHRAGASGSIGAVAARRAEADGDTLLFAPADVLVNNTAIFRDLPYEPLRDFVPLVRIGPIPLVLVVPGAQGVASLAGFESWARTRRIGYGSWGEGSHAHLLGDALLVRRLELDAVHVPYRGLGPMVLDLVGAQLAAGFAVPPSCVQHVRTGRLRALAVTGDRRSRVLADVPTLDELGYVDPVFGLRQWAALLAPTGTPADACDRLEALFKSALDDAQVRESLLAAGFEIERAQGSQQARDALRAELQLVPSLIHRLGVTRR